MLKKTTKGNKSKHKLFVLSQRHGQSMMKLPRRIKKNLSIRETKTPIKERETKLPCRKTITFFKGKNFDYNNSLDI